MDSLAAPPSMSSSEDRIGDPSVTGRCFDVGALLEELLAGDSSRAWDRVASAHRRGDDALGLLMGELSEVGRRLDRLWDLDECTSLEVAMATCQLRTLAQHLVSAAVADAPEVEPRRTAITWSPRGDRVGFGAMLHECSLELLGWHVERFDGLPAREVLDRLRASGADMLLCVLDDERLLAGTCRGLRHFREASCNRELDIIGAGRAFCSCSRREDCAVNRVSSSAEDTVDLAGTGLERQVA